MPAESLPKPASISMRAAGPPLLLLASWLVATSRTWLRGETYFLRDFWMNYVPAREVLREAFMRNALPLWNPWIGGGIPVLPDPNNSVFYWPVWPFLLLAHQDWALSLVVNLHLLLAMFGAYFLARRWASPWASVLAGTGFGLGGLLQSNVVNVHWHFAYAWAPLWFLAALRLIDSAAAPWKPRLQAIAALALVWGLQLVASEPQIVYLEGLSIPLLLMGTQRERGRAFGGFVAATLLSLSLAAPQLGAFVEALPWTDRVRTTSADSGIWSLAFGRFWELIFPQPWGALTPVTSFWGQHLIHGPWNNFYFTSLYVTALALPLAGFGAVALWRSERRGAAGWIALGVSLLVLAALGNELPFNDLLRRFLPLWNTFRYPERFMVLPALALAISLAIGADALLARPRLGAAMLIFPAAVAAVACVAPGLLGPAPTWEIARNTVQRAALQPAIASLLAAAIVWRAPATSRPMLLAAIAAVDGVVLSFSLLATWVPPMPSAMFVDEPERIVFSTADITRAAMNLPPEPALRRAFEDHFNRPNLGVVRRVRSVSSLTAMEFSRARMLRDALGPERAWQAFQARYVVASQRAALRTYLPDQDLTQGLLRFRYSGTLSAVSCSLSWKWVDGPAAAAKEVGRVPVAERSGPAAWVGSSTEATAPLPCILERGASGDMGVQLPDSEQPTWVKISESFFPGWQITTERGEALVPVVADLAFLGFIAPPHASHIQLHFRPTWLTPALLVSGFGTLLTLAMLGAAWRR